MDEGDRPQDQDVQPESPERPGKVPLTARLLLLDSLTARRASRC